MRNDDIKFEMFEKLFDNFRQWFGCRDLINVANDLEAVKGETGPFILSRWPLNEGDGYIRQ